ncbi:MAG: hypothetical protein K5864_05780 [Bacteroidales bacterium]|nr:hypothetical protein [Bacteroidales bacterium]
MRRRLLIIILLIIAATQAFAQSDSTAGQTPRVVYLSARDLCPGHNIDVRLIDDGTILNHIVDSLKGVQPNAYPLISQWCNSQRRRITRFRNSLLDDYKWDRNLVWMDSTHCIIDAGPFVNTAQKRIELLEELSEFYESEEKKRIEEERKAAEAHAIMESIRIQQEKEDLLAWYQDTIKALHQEISTVCDGKTLTDKERLKQLKDLYYAYLSIYNRYDLSSRSTEEHRFEQLKELHQFQTEMLDSILGNNSYATRINEFSTTLKARCGKTHADINKSYAKAVKRMQVPVNFKTLAEYRRYVNGLREILIVQEYYLAAIDYRDTLASNTNKLQNLSSRRHKEIYTSYQQMLSDYNLLPEFTNQKEGEQYLALLQELTLVQEEYIAAFGRLDIIERRGDSIVNNCPRKIADMSTAYKQMAAKYDFVPSFRNLSGAASYNKHLDDFEVMQTIYAEGISLRNAIASKADTINGSRTAPKGLSSGYKQMSSYTVFTPTFSTTSGGEQYLSQLREFLNIQDKFITIIVTNDKIESTSRRFKTAFREYPNIGKAYERVLKTYDYDLNILSMVDINTYIRHQQQVLDMQAQFDEVLSGNEKSRYNERLKKEKDVANIKLIMHVN